MLKCDSSPGNFGEDLFGSSGPDERLRVVVGGFQVVLDRRDELVYAVEHAPVQGLFGQIPKPPFDQIEPRGEGGDKVQVKPRVFGQPLCNVGMLVDAVVVTEAMPVEDELSDLVAARRRGNRRAVAE